MAILKVPENYDSLKDGLSDIVKEASDLKSIDIKARVHQIEYFLGGDLKFLDIVCHRGPIKLDFWGGSLNH